MRRLVNTAGVVVANLPPQTLRTMKLDYESLKAIKPDIILTTATAFGGPGPWSDRVGFDGVGQVMSGSVYMTGAGDPRLRRHLFEWPPAACTAVLHIWGIILPSAAVHESVAISSAGVGAISPRFFGMMASACVAQSSLCRRHTQRV
jgi:crotonobetainyl-CoA:carnitine CoA-transferase CaiB-like acyl-CoA transferase